MPSDFSKNLTIRYKRFITWTKSDDFTSLIAKFMAIFVIGLMVLSVFVVLL